MVLYNKNEKMFEKTIDKIKKMENFVHLNLTLENLIYSDEECSWASL